MAKTSMRRAATVCARVVLLGALGTGFAAAARAEEAASPDVGVDEKVGDTVTLDGLTFSDEDGRPLALKALFDRPIVLTFAYFRCPGICTPLLQEVCRVADLCDLRAGRDYRLLTIGFDPRETPDLARNKKSSLLGSMKRQKVAPEGWRILTGDAANIARVTQAVGFHYAPDRTGADFVHAATVIFLSKEGRIIRYLSGTEFNPAELKMAVLDAAADRPRSFMQKTERICYSETPPVGQTVTLVSRILLGVTLGLVLVFVSFLYYSGKHKHQQNGNPS